MLYGETIEREGFEKVAGGARGPRLLGLRPLVVLGRTRSYLGSLLFPQQ